MMPHQLPNDEAFYATYIPQPHFYPQQVFPMPSPPEPQPAPTPSSSGTRSKHPSLLACLTCRKKHLKCDAQMPICGRCAEYGSECQYVKSRRGYKGPNKRARTTSDDDSAEGGIDDETPAQSVSSQGQESSTAAWVATTARASSALSVGDPAYPGNSLVQIERAKSSSSDPLIDLYYSRFHAAHPVALPRKMFVKNPQLVPDYLKNVMRLVGSRFVIDFQRDSLQQEAMTFLNGAITDSGFKVQALLLFAMHSFACLDHEAGNRALSDGIDTALRIGMNRSDFPMGGELADPILKESWRRTWWELFVVSGLISALYASDIHASKILSAELSAPLPGHCEDYNECRPHTNLRSLHDIEDRAFVDENYDYSSFAYKVEAGRLLFSALQLGRDQFMISDSQIDGVDAALANYLVALPPPKRSVVRRHGDIDETLFFAYMIIHFTSIIVHRPRSGLAFVRNHYPTICTKVQTAAVGGLEYESHTTKALQAANALSNLAALRTPLTNHTPCFSCSIAAAATVQLPAYLIEDQVIESQGLKERLQLALSSLASISEVWPMAAMVRSQLTSFARETFIRPSTSTGHVDSTGTSISSASGTSMAGQQHPHPQQHLPQPQQHQQQPQIYGSTPGLLPAVANEHVRALEELFDTSGSGAHGIDGSSLWPDMSAMGPGSSGAASVHADVDPLAAYATAAR